MPSPEPGETETKIDRPWTDLVSQLKPGDAGISRNRLVSFLLNELLETLVAFERTGFEVFSDAWRELDLLLGKRIQLEHNGQILTGVTHGVDKNGGLLLETAQSETQVFHSGEVSIHRD